MRMRNLSFIWFVGAVVWWIDAAVAVHYNNRAHAVLALAVACIVTGPPPEPLCG